MENSKTKQIVIMGMMIAMEIVLTRFLSVTTLPVRYGIGFLPIAITAMLYGPFNAAIASVLADFIGVNFFSGTTWFPGFTLTAFLIGMVYGLLMYKNVGNTARIIIAVLIVTIILQLGLDTFWVQMISGTNYFAHLPVRIVRALVMIPIQFVLIKTFARILIVHGHKIIGKSVKGNQS